MDVHETTSAVTVAMLALPFRPSHPASPFPRTAPQSEADWRLYHISAWAGLIEQIGWAWDDVEVVEADNGSSDFDNHQYLIRVPFVGGGGADWAVCWTEAAPGFERGDLRVSVMWDPDAESAESAEGVVEGCEHVLEAIHLADAAERYEADFAA